jgi:hypothetical protein
MHEKGKITDLDEINRVARVTFLHLDGVTTYSIPYAKHVSPKINDIAAVAFFSDDLSDGLIIAVI